MVVLGEQQVRLLDQKYGIAVAKREIMKCLRFYAEQIKQEFGFESFAIDLHYDEGRHETVINSGSQSRVFIRNYHAHIQFFNYDFSKKLSPLRHLMKKGVKENGKTCQLNPHFEKMQDLAAKSFFRLGFIRGQSKNVKSVEHLEKEAFVKQKILQNEGLHRSLFAQCKEL